MWLSDLLIIWFFEQTIARFNAIKYTYEKNRFLQCTFFRFFIFVL